MSDTNQGAPEVKAALNAVAITDGLNVREKPTMESAVVRTLNKGDKVNATPSTSGWSRVAPEGYTMTRFLKQI